MSEDELNQSDVGHHGTQSDPVLLGPSESDWALRKEDKKDKDKDKKKLQGRLGNKEAISAVMVGG